MTTEQPTPPPVVLSTALLGGTATTASTTTQAAMTMADLDRMVQVLRSIPPEPIGEWMREQGRPPEQWRVVMPQKVRDEVDGPVFWPDYVAFSPLLDKPVFIPRGLWAWDLSANAESNGGASHPTRTPC